MNWTGWMKWESCNFIKKEFEISNRPLSLQNHFLASRIGRNVNISIRFLFDLYTHYLILQFSYKFNNTQIFYDWIMGPVVTYDRRRNISF